MFLVGTNSVSQREIQRCFNLIEFFWKLKLEEGGDPPDQTVCITLALALTYYFRLPTKEDKQQRNDEETPSREDLAAVLSRRITRFEDIIQEELKSFVNDDNFLIPKGVALNQAVCISSFYI